MLLYPKVLSPVEEGEHSKLLFFEACQMPIRNRVESIGKKRSGMSLIHELLLLSIVLVNYGCNNAV